MGRRVIFIAGFVLIAAFSAGAYMLLQTPEEASAPIEAVPLDLDSPDDGAADSSADEGSEATDASEGSTDTADTTGEAGEESGSQVEAASSLVLFTINPAESQVRFELDEDLRGVRKTVVGESDQVTGEIAIDMADLSTTQVGVILVNARTLQTDSNFRNRAIANRILETNSFEFVTFEPKSIEGLSGSAAVGDSLTFSVIGDLTIRDITHEVTFQVEATAASEGSISGSASTVVNRADFSLVIPSVENVANVEEEVELYIDFVANSG